MKNARLAVVAFAALTLAACSGSNEDQLEDSEINAAESTTLDVLANDAASVASEAQELEQQAQQLEEQAQQVENAAGPETPAD